jgi:hypothetical protein
MIPSAVSSGKVHSVFPNSTDADFDFNRDSSATRVNSQGLIETVGYFGSELVTNGSFDTDSNWVKGTGWSIANGKASFDGGADAALTQSNVVQPNTLYKVLFTVTDRTTGSLQLRLGNSGVVDVTVNSNNNFSFDLTTDSSGTSVYFRAIGGFDGSIDNVSVKEITGDRARLNYEIEGGLVNTKPSLLLEPQSTNLVTYSEDFSAYTTNNSSVLSNIVSSPDGSLSASKLIENTATAEHTIQKAVSVTSGNAYSISVFVKKEEISSVQFGFTGSNFASPTRSVFNIENGTITTNVNNTASIQNYGNGWYKLKVTNTTNATGTAMLMLQSIKSGQANYAGDGVSGFYMWGLQWEQQSYSTSYIPTNGSTQTRAAETCNGAGTSSIFESTEGILYTEISVNGLPSSGFLIMSLNDGGVNNNVFIEIGTNGLLTFFVISGGTNVASKVSSVNPLNNFVKCAIRYKLNDVSFWINGTEIHSDTSATMPVGLSQLDFDYGNGAHKFYGNVRDIRVYNTKEMTDSEVDILLTKITS